MSEEDRDLALMVLGTLAVAPLAAHIGWDVAAGIVGSWLMAAWVSLLVVACANRVHRHGGTAAGVVMLLLALAWTARQWFTWWVAT